MNLGITTRAVIDRLQADSTLYTGGAWTSAISGGIRAYVGNPETLTYPFGVYSCSNQYDNAFTTLEADASVEFTFFDTADRGIDRLCTIEERITGNAMLVAGRSPSYGFHLFKPTLATNTFGAVAGHFLIESSKIEPVNEHINSLTITFKVRWSATAVSP